MRPWLIAMLLLSAVLAGCSEGPATGEDTQDDGPGDAPDADGQANNTAPLANLTADVLNGTAPLLVNLTLTGSDADGDNLTWTLHLNGTQIANGSRLPAAHGLNLTAGNHTIRLAVSDGNASANATLTIAVVQADLGPCAGQEEPCIIGEDRWVLFYSDGTCHMKAEFVQSRTGGIYINDRPNDGSPNGLYSGGGTWVYEEDNDVGGLQIGGPDEAAAYTGCVNPDHLIF